MLGAKQGGVACQCLVKLVESASARKVAISRDAVVKIIAAMGKAESLWVWHRCVH